MFCADNACIGKLEDRWRPIYFVQRIKHSRSLPGLDLLSEIDAGRPAQAAEMARTHANVHGRLIAAGLEVRSASRRSFRVFRSPTLAVAPSPP